MPECQTTPCHADPTETGCGGVHRMLVYSFECAHDHTPPWQLIKLPEYVDTLGARCLDGSPASMFVQSGEGLLPDSFIIDFEGGGWCYGSDADPTNPLPGCAARAGSTFGSSTRLSETMPYPGGFLSSSPTDNPDFHNWTKVFVNYCDGISYVGDRTEPVVDKASGTPVYFRGKRILDAVIAGLAASHGLTAAKRVIVSGNSAGGLTVYLHLDRIAALVNGVAPAASVVGFPDGGYFLDIENTAGRKVFRQKMEATFDLANGSSGVNAACKAAHPANVSDCLFAQHTFPHLKTPLFALQSQYDAWQLGWVLELRDPTGAVAIAGRSPTAACLKDKVCSARFQGFKDSMVDLFAPVEATAKGVYLSSCLVHCQATVDGSGIFAGHAAEGWTVSNRTVSKAFGDCYFGRGSCQSVDTVRWPGNPTCL